MKYIDADLLRKKIEAQRDLFIGHAAILKKTVATDGFDAVLGVINSLQQEQPEEVDLDEEMDRFFEEMPVLEHENIFEDTYQLIARHFYELGKNSN